MIELALERVLFVPARIPPHKRVEHEPGAQHRLELCRRAVAGNASFEVSELELRREGPSYTVDTLKELRTHAPQDELVLILGGDVAAGLPDWHMAERVMSLARVAVAKRRGTSQGKVERALASLPGGEQAEFFAMPRIGISSTMVRRRVHSGRSIRYLVTEPVREYIDAHGLYREESHNPPGRA
jgi:nicotinate-nucleotide adenylyltransferase